MLCDYLPSICTTSVPIDAITVGKSWRATNISPNAFARRSTPSRPPQASRHARRLERYVPRVLSELGVSEKTVKNRLIGILAKLHASGRTHAVMIAWSAVSSAAQRGRHSAHSRAVKRGLHLLMGAQHLLCAGQHPRDLHPAPTQGFFAVSGWNERCSRG